MYNRSLILDKSQMRVNLGIWPIFAFLTNPAFWTATGQVVTTAATTAASYGVSQLFNSMSSPQYNPSTYVGSIATRNMASSPQTTALLQQQEELNRLHQEQLEKEEELKNLQVQAEQKQQTLSKYAPWIVAGGIIFLAVVLFTRRRK